MTASPQVSPTVVQTVSILMIYFNCSWIKMMHTHYESMHQHESVIGSCSCSNVILPTDMATLWLPPVWS